MMIVMTLVVVGVAGYLHLGVDRFPSVDVPVVRINARLPGASPVLAVPFALHAANGERQRLQPLSRDLAAAFGAVAILPGVETHQRFPDPLERVPFHLNQGDFDVLLVVRLGVLGFVQPFGRPFRG